MAPIVYLTIIKSKFLYSCIAVLPTVIIIIIFIIIETKGRPTSSEQICTSPNAAYEKAYTSINPAYGEARTQNIIYEEITPSRIMV